MQSVLDQVQERASCFCFKITSPLAWRQKDVKMTTRTGNLKRFHVSQHVSPTVYWCTTLQACKFTHPPINPLFPAVKLHKLHVAELHRGGLQQRKVLSHCMAARCQRSSADDLCCHKDVSIIRGVMVCLLSFFVVVFFTFYLQLELHKWCMCNSTGCIRILCKSNELHVQCDTF